MTWRSLRFLPILLLTVSEPPTSLFSQQKKVAPAYRIAGIVVNARDHSPVRHCFLTARLSGGERGGPRDPATAETDEQGDFALALPSAGNWELTATAHNIRSQLFDSHEGYFTGIVLTAQSPNYDLVFQATPDAIVTGTVTDEAGEPVRNAQVALFANDPAARQTGGTGLQRRQGTQTDDRGRYEMAGLDPGEYMVQVQARPWYASPPANSGNRPATSVPSPDPSLDVVYPITWYPGVADASSAGILSAHPGDALQADFRLSPVPSAHLLIPSPAPPPPIAGRQEPGGFVPSLQMPRISLLLPGGNFQQVFGQFSRGPSGDFDISGLAPGTYEIAYPGVGPDSPGRTSIVRIQPGGSSTDMSAAIPMSTVAIAVDGGTSAGASQIMLRDLATGQSFTSSGRPGGGRFPGQQGPGPLRQVDPPPARGAQSGPRGRPGGGGQQGRGRPRPTDGEEVTLQVPPGRYDVTVRDDSAFVTGLTAKGATAAGRSITIPESPVHLIVHLASGFAGVSGTTLLAGKPCAGAMVLLVPATLGDPASLTIVRRDQTNSDGSFHLTEVIPGQYILLAIDHGWAIRWTDPATLRPYLMQGTPLDLRSSSTVSPRLTAIAP